MQDKLRFTSTCSIHNAFQPWGCPYMPAAADDLDSFLQTFLHALLLRRGEEVEDVRHFYDKLGNLDLHLLGRTRDGIRGTLWCLGDDVKRKERKERERAKKEKEKAEREKRIATRAGTRIPSGMRPLLNPSQTSKRRRRRTRMT